MSGSLAPEEVQPFRLSYFLESLRDGTIQDETCHHFCQGETVVLDAAPLSELPVMFRVVRFYSRYRLPSRDEMGVYQRRGCVVYRLYYDADGMRALSANG